MKKIMACNFVNVVNAKDTCMHKMIFSPKVLPIILTFIYFFYNKNINKDPMLRFLIYATTSV